MGILGITLNLKISYRKAEILGAKVEESGRKKGENRQNMTNSRFFGIQSL